MAFVWSSKWPHVVEQLSSAANVNWECFFYNAVSNNSRALVRAKVDSGQARVVRTLLAVYTAIFTLLKGRNASAPIASLYSD